MYPKICVVQINVTDMDEATDFYCNKIGFKINNREYYPQLLSLENSGVYFILSKVEKSAVINYPVEAGTMINIEVSDLEKSIKELKSKGVEFIHSTPQKCPVGIYAAIKDPSGNVMELLEFQFDKK